MIFYNQEWKDQALNSTQDKYMADEYDNLF